MALDEAIKHCLEVAEGNDLAAGMYELLAENNHNAYEKLTAETNSSRCTECATDHRQLAEWLTERKDLQEENKVLMRECDRLIKEKGELLKKSEQITEYKRLLKAAVEDFFFVSEKFINSMDSSCSMFNHIAGCVKDCPMSSSDDYGRCKWRYTDEALKLIGGSENDT